MLAAFDDKVVFAENDRDFWAALYIVHCWLRSCHLPSQGEKSMLVYISCNRSNGKSREVEQCGKLKNVSEILKVCTDVHSELHVPVVILKVCVQNYTCQIYWKCAQFRIHLTVMLKVYTFSELHMPVILKVSQFRITHVRDIKYVHSELHLPHILKVQV